MTRATNARVAGVTFLVYTVTSLCASLLFGRATSAEGIAAILARIGQHAAEMRLAIVLSLVGCFAAIVLGVTLYAITRDEDLDIAMVALACRVGEAVLSAIVILAKLELLWLATAAGANVPDQAAAKALSALLLTGTRVWNTTISATFFAVGSTLFSWLLLRGRIIPIPLAWLGVVVSVLAVVAIPLQLAGLLGDPITTLILLSMLAFEVPFALWLIIKGVAAPARRQSP